MENANVGLSYGYGYGYGYGSGYGDGDGYGSGDGSGDGYGDGYGYGSGYGDGDGYGSGNGSGYGYGSGDGSGYGYGYGSGDGSGDGNGSQKFKIRKEQAWIAYHYLKKFSDGFYVLRSGRKVKIGEVLKEQKIKMCEYGLHASLCPDDARSYKPLDSVLTKVLIWGTIICQKDKLVATHRQIIEEI